VTGRTSDTERMLRDFGAALLTIGEQLLAARAVPSGPRL
jgi:hypothetical protein